jgi:hypothetical protein
MLYIVSELFQKSLITEEQKLALKFGILNDDSVLLDFYFEVLQPPEALENTEMFKI